MSSREGIVRRGPSPVLRRPLTGGRKHDGTEAGRVTMFPISPPRQEVKRRRSVRRGGPPEKEVGAGAASRPSL